MPRKATKAKATTKTKAAPKATPQARPKSRTSVPVAGKPRIVEAVGTMVSTASMQRDPSGANRIEQAMANAIKKALADGITDPAKQRALIKEARDKAVAEG
jgi:hypothetical protein